jgi:hypothetical protein
MSRAYCVVRITVVIINALCSLNTQYSRRNAQYNELIILN